MITNTLVDEGVVAAALEAMAAGGTVLATEDYFGAKLSTPGYAPMGKLGWLVSAVWGATLSMMATGMWFDGRGVPEITLESSWRLTSHGARVRGHVDLVLAVARALSEDK